MKNPPLLLKRYAASHNRSSRGSDFLNFLHHAEIRVHMEGFLHRGARDSCVSVPKGVHIPNAPPL